MPRSGLPKYCSWNRDRESGKRRVRFRRSGVSLYLTGTPWSEDFMRQYAAALDGVRAERREVGAARTVAGSINALIVSYYQLVFPTLKRSTQGVRRRILERFRREHGAKPVARLEHQHIASLLAARANTPHAANNLRSVLHHLLEHGIAIGMLDRNPVAHIKKLKVADDGFHTWTDDEAARFEARHPVGSAAYLALHLLLDTGQRRSDVVRMGWQHVGNGKLAVRQEKTSTPLLIPITAALARALAGVPRTNLTFLLAASGGPFTPNGFSKYFRKRCNEAGLCHCAAHGLRKLAATRLANAGASEREIMAITGHRSVAEVSRYTRAADQVRLAEQAMQRINEEQNAPPKMSSTRLAGQKTRLTP